MTEIQNPKQKKTISLKRFGIWNLRFICNLVLGIFDLRHQTPRQSRGTLTPAIRDRHGPSKIPPCGERPAFYDKLNTRPFHYLKIGVFNGL